MTVLAGGCVPAPTEPAAVQTVTTVVTVPGQTPDPGIVQDRRTIGQPAVDVVELTLDAARRADFIRHQLPVGTPRRDAITDARETLTFLDDARSTLDQSVPALASDLVADRATALSAAARDVAGDVAGELDRLDAYAGVETALEDIVATWSVSGTRPEIADRLADLVVTAESVVTQAQGLPVAPPDCPGPRDNRIRWAQVVAARTAELQALATAREGDRFDDLLAGFTDQPFGEDPVDADAATRPCWAEHSALDDVRPMMTGLLEDVEDALQG